MLLVASASTSAIVLVLRVVYTIVVQCRTQNKLSLCGVRFRLCNTSMYVSCSLCCICSILVYSSTRSTSRLRGYEVDYATRSRV